MNVLALAGCVLDRASKEEEFMGRGTKRGLMEDDGVTIVSVACLLPGRQVPSDQ
jgi:hypothetical protein